MNALFKGLDVPLDNGLKLFLEKEDMERLYDFEEECVEGYFRELDIALQQSTEERIKATNERVENMAQKVEDINQKENLQSATVQVSCLISLVFVIFHFYFHLLKTTLAHFVYNNKSLIFFFAVVVIVLPFVTRLWIFDCEKWKNLPNKFYPHWLLFIVLCQRTQHYKTVCKGQWLMFMNRYD